VQVPLSFSFSPFHSLSLSLSLSLSFSILAVSNSNKQTGRTSREARAICYRLPWGQKITAIHRMELRQTSRYRAGNASRLKSQKAKRYYKTNASGPNGGMAFDRLMKTPMLVLFSFSFFFTSASMLSNFVVPSQPPICNSSYA